MSIYTKTGDNGTTSLYGGKRILKSDLQVEACGSLDELSSFIGLLIAKIESPPQKEFLTSIQKELYHIMALLAVGRPPGGRMDSLRVKNHLETQVKKIEQKIDFISSRLPKLNKFVLPQGNEISSLFHITRAVCRRSERNVVRYFKGLQLPIIKYLNRLSDLFFILARFYNTKEVLVKL